MIAKFDTHKADREQERKRKTMNNQPGEFVCLHDGAGLEREGKMTTFMDSYKSLELA